MRARDPRELERVQGLRARHLGELRRLAALIGDAVREHRDRALATGGADGLMRIASQGAGDVTYGIDVPAEHALDVWLDEVARAGPLSLLTEDSGWRHRGPDGKGGVRALDGFDHGGPRIVVDPIDGTRNLMTDLRPAWTVIGLAGPGVGEPWQKDVVLGVVREIPESRSTSTRELLAARGEGCVLVDGASERRLDTGSDARADHGYFPFFKYLPTERHEIAEVEARFFERLARIEGADVRNCYDDQYISNAGQLVLLALGTYRMIADLRAVLAARRGGTTLTTKPYDVSGALVCAVEAGCVVTAWDGGELDFPIDVVTPVSFVGWTNEATRARLARHLAASF
ncbi:MAG: hypothetical protein IPJ77_02240 [Planctomycetes bacterium]|nr:hypothetical protein [Planctomycetota bacterium]